MKPEIKQKWIEALTSGKYEQGRGNLRTGDKYCCLGVLCDLYTKEKGGEWSEGRDDIPYEDTQFSIGNELTFLPGAVKHWAGLTHMIPHFGGISLIYLNDVEKKTFLEIADRISTNPGG